MTIQDEIKEGIHKILKRHVKASIVQGKYLDGCTEMVGYEILRQRD